MALAGVELETLVSETDALTTKIIDANFITVSNRMKILCKNKISIYLQLTSYKEKEEKVR